jgi:hypothetical protein
MEVFGTAQNRDYVRKFIEADERLVVKQAIEDASLAFIGATYRAKSGAFEARLICADGKVLTMRREDTGAEYKITAGELATCYENN